MEILNFYSNAENYFSPLKVNNFIILFLDETNLTRV
jgi:hypothetical protein